MEAQSEHVHIAPTFFFCTFGVDLRAQSVRLLTKFLHRSSGGSLLRVLCRLGQGVKTGNQANKGLPFEFPQVPSALARTASRSGARSPQTAPGVKWWVQSKISDSTMCMYKNYRPCSKT